MKKPEFPAVTLYGTPGTLISLPGITVPARCGYALFARCRNYLPRRRNTCATGACPRGERK